MLSQRLRRHSRTTVLVFAGLLAACSTSTDTLPDRAGFPRTLPENEGLSVPGEGPVLRELPVDSLDPELFAATRAALARGDWMAATLALPTIHTAPPAPPRLRDEPIAPTANRRESRGATQLWIDYYHARIALLRGDRDGYAKLVNTLTAQALPEDLRRELMLHELEVAEQSDSAADQLLMGLRLQRAGGHPLRATDALTDSLWNAVQRLSPGERTTLRSAGDEELNGWFELAAANRTAAALDAAAALAAWESRYPRHPATERATALREAALRDSQTEHISIILPLSGPLENAGDAVSRGFIAAFYAARDGRASIDVIDSRRFESTAESYSAAQERGADVVVGPLGKLQVEAMLMQPSLPVPVLTLNRPEQSVTARPEVLLLSLAPEDEAAQLADAAWAAGQRRALLIRPEGAWGERMQAALARRWRELGGQLPSTAVYGKPSTHSDAIRDSLGLGASAERSSALRSLFRERVETSGRRREDLDGIFLLSKNSEEARALKPLINYHYAGDLPVYTLSTADSGITDADLNRDLGGLRLLAMPWRLDNATLPGGETGGSFAALHALGADAYALARRWWRMRSAATPLYPGLTAELQAIDDGTLLRRLDVAEFDRGELRPR